MKYLPLRDFDLVTNALNFSTPDVHVIGGCDVYTTKAAGSDKKLYKNIEESLESQYESLVRLSASLSPPHRTASDDGNENGAGRGRSVGIPDIDLSRSSPFGPLSQISARRTFAYLIATLNASHPDYDFSHTLRPSDFRKTNPVKIRKDVDSALQNLRPRHHAYSSNAYLAPRVATAPTILTSEVWNDSMWARIDKEMDLAACRAFTYVPDDDPFDGEEGALWSSHYFLFHKDKKRVCYLHLRALSVISHSPIYTAPTHHLHGGVARKANNVSFGEGASKRASYWLGSTSAAAVVAPEDDDDDDEMIDPDDDEVEQVPYMDLDDIRSDLADGAGYGYYDYDDDGEAFLDEGWTPTYPARHVRGVSEEIGEVMEL